MTPCADIEHLCSMTMALVSKSMGPSPGHVAITVTCMNVGFLISRDTQPRVNSYSSSS